MPDLAFEKSFLFVSNLQREFTIFERLFAETDTGCILGGSALGSRDVSASDIGSKAATELVSYVEGEYCVDQHTQDQVNLEPTH